MNIPIPPEQLRIQTGPRDIEFYLNKNGALLYGHLPPEQYHSVFDFGCGCGRVAIRLLQQKTLPTRYMGIDPHNGLIDWAKNNLTPYNNAFQFEHHNVYSPGYAPGNRLVLADTFPVDSGWATLVIAHSVFTHLTCEQATYYLSEIKRVLAPTGVAFTSWFFFDNDSFPFWEPKPYALYASDKDFSAAVIFDRKWFVETLRNLGLMVERCHPPTLPGHQWEVFLKHQTPGAKDNFPMGAEAAEYVCGATWKPMERSKATDDPHASSGTGNPERKQDLTKKPELFGPLAELQKLQTQKPKKPWWRIR